MRTVTAAALAAVAMTAACAGGDVDEPEAAGATTTPAAPVSTAPPATPPPAEMQVVVVAGEQFLDDVDGCPALTETNVGPDTRVEVTTGDTLLGTATLGAGTPVAAPGPDGDPVDGAAFCEFATTVPLDQQADTLAVTVAGHDPVRFTAAEVSDAGQATVRLGTATGDPKLVEQARRDADYDAIVAMLQRRISADLEQTLRAQVTTNYQQPYTLEECWESTAGLPYPESNWDTYRSDVTWDRDTLKATPGWTIPAGRLAGTVPEGRIYEMETSTSEQFDGVEVGAPAGMRHYTVIDGEAFAFFACE